ncbi:MAG: hypothetical protein N3A38_17145, partial [Planctomycetota bacterium]|nr:hypothetical protein [Planctomycetota bacterium]
MRKHKRRRENRAEKEERMPLTARGSRFFGGGGVTPGGAGPAARTAAGGGEACPRTPAGRSGTCRGRFLRAAAALALVAAVGLPCAAAVVLPLGIRELAGGASRIVEGRVESLRVCGDVSDIH